ncbi:hypothetical protein [Nocardia altamirensis]|uniref:hypothetical protein n=1 Tax=Nocardia altamirensis TaxID=472158 RepID=UPI00114D129B|nr:hypothetical protein [Nocardia altamirensis]
MVIVVSGALLVLTAGWVWRGRSPRARGWVRDASGRRLLFALVPGLGLLIFGGGALSLAQRVAPGLFGLVTAVVGLPMLFGAALVVAGMVHVPTWWGPRWYRSGKSGGATGIRAKVLPAILDRAGVRDAGESARMVEGVAPIGSWSAAWVYDPDTDERAHELSARGAVAGRLFVYRVGIVFVASAVEKKAWGRDIVLGIDIADITDARKLPPRAGADGHPRKGVLHRSLYPRLGIYTRHGDYVFDLAGSRARRVAELVRSALPGNGVRQH